MGVASCVLCDFAWQDCHNRAWATVGSWVEENMTIWSGKTQDAESSILPKVRSWLRNMAMQHGNSVDDHTVVLWCNCPALGILSASKTNFLLNLVANVLSDFPGQWSLLPDPPQQGWAACRRQDL